MKKVLAGIGIVAVAVGGLAACEPTVRCGAVLTENTRLTADLVGCTGDALVVGADHIVIDLGGHTVRSVDGAGLRIDGRRGVRVRGGATEGGDAGLVATDATQLAIDDVVLRGDDVGLRLERVTNSTVRRTTAHGLTGIELIDAHRNRFEAADAPGAGPDSGNGIRLTGSDENRISGGRYNGGNDSMALVDSHRNTLLDNDASGSNTVGILLFRSDANDLRRNVAGSEVGAIEVVESSDNLVEHTRLSAPGRGGEPEAIVVRGSDRTRLWHNEVGDVFVRDSTRTNIRDNDVDRILVSSSDRTELDGNHLVAGFVGWRDPDVGILVEGDATRSIVRGNVVSGFLVDGISIGAPGTAVRRNTADDNGDHGIVAVPGVVDGGGNRASGNGNPVQCVNVVCR